MKTKTGFFKPRNKNKYKGDPTKIVYRSSWELKLMYVLDEHTDIIEWSSEEIVIPYKSPIDGKKHRYFPDFWIKKKLADGNIEHVLIEVKPKIQTRPPIVRKRVTKKYLTEVATWGVNSAKWDAAESYCKSRGWRFMIMHEGHLGL